MAKPTLSMKPTGWFQVAWSAEIQVCQVHKMTYFGQELVAWRAQDGTVTVMSAYCEHLGAHLGFGGRVEGDRIICPFHGREWNQQGRNVCIPYQDRPNKARTISRAVMLGAKPEASSRIENAQMFHMSAGLRPKRSASRPNRKAPIGRIARVRNKAVEPTCMLECRSAEMSLNMNTIKKKSNASRVQPR